MKNIKKLAMATAIASIFAGSSAVLAGHHHKNHGKHHGFKQFERIATLPVYLNTDQNLETVAEIIDASKDGNTLVYTDSETGKIGFIDITDPANPAVDGTVELGGEPTSVAVAGNYALAAINTSTNYVNTSGDLKVVDINSRNIVASLELGGQPDSVAVSPDGRFAAVVIENERDEDLTVNGEEGALPQAPSGFLVIVDLQGEPSQWTTRTVDLSGLADVAPEDAEPEYVDINRSNIAAVTLQENNHIVFVHLPSGRIVTDYNLGGVDLTDIDTEKDKVITLDGSLNDVPREPDAVTWINNFQVATANEGDWNGGSRGFSVFGLFGGLKYDTGNRFEQLAVRHGHYPEKRAGKKGAEPEGVEAARFGRENLLFVGSERANFVSVYRMSVNGKPQFKQLLPVTNGPEGLKAIPKRGLFVVASEKDDADEGIRSTISIFKLKQGEASYPTIISDDDANGNPIPWGALSALVGDATDPNKLYTVHDSFYQASKIYTVDAGSKPARITSALQLNCNGAPCNNYDPEGIALDSDGNFWLASEGKANTRKNLLIKVAADGTVLEEVELPESVQARFQKHGFEGVTVADGLVYVAFQRDTWDGGNGYARIGRYSPASGEWAFYHYPMDAPTSPAGGWVGLSEITYLGNDTFAVIERDNQRGDNASLKRLYTFSINGLTPVADNPEADFPVLTKGGMFDLLPGLQAPNGWVQDKAEGLGVTADGKVYMVTDNDGVDDATGETQFQYLGHQNDVFRQ
jgi:hypothetical protein